MERADPKSEVIGRSEFETWLMEHYSYWPDGTPVDRAMPMFLRPDGWFDVDTHRSWIEQREKEFMMEKYRRQLC